jgi:hypothetical protein
VQYKAQRAAMGGMVQETGVITGRKTHLGRSGGAQLLEERCVATEEIARAGRWKRTVMEVAYLKMLSWPAMEAMAGFEPDGSCFLPRDIPVPPGLLRKVSPQVEHW